MVNNREETKVVILCGGKGTRIADVDSTIPKPMIPIGQYPILYHIMKGYADQGYRDFVLGLGYRGEVIRDYFLNGGRVGDITVDGANGKSTEVRNHDNFRVTLANTGAETLTALRLKRIAHYLDGDDKFMLTYGDGVANVDINALLDFHASRGKIGTITAVHDRSRYGVLNIQEGIVKKFIEKGTITGDRINGGFMVFNRRFLEHPMLTQNVALEDVLADLVANGQLAAYQHDGFWHSMDTSRDYNELNLLWDSGKAPWKI